MKPDPQTLENSLGTKVAGAVALSLIVDACLLAVLLRVGVAQLWGVRRALLVLCVVAILGRCVLRVTSLWLGPIPN